MGCASWKTATPCNTLQHTATHCNTQCIMEECEGERIPDGLGVADVDGVEPLFIFTAHESEG